MKNKELIFLYLFFENPLNQIRLLVVVRAEDDVDTDVLEGHQLFFLVLLNFRRVKDGSIVLADADVSALVLVLRGKGSKGAFIYSNLILSLKINSYQFCHVVVELELELLLFAGLKEADVDLLGDDLRADVVLDGEAEPHLLQDQLHLLPPLHRTAGLHL